MAGPRLSGAGDVSPDEAANLGIDALRDGTEQAVLPLVEAATRNYPNEPRLWQVTGLLHRAMDDLQPAIDALEKAARLAPHDAKIAHALARAYLEAGKPRIDLFDRAERLAPNDLTIILARSAALLMERRGDDAIRGLEARLLDQPQWLDGHALLARIRTVIGRRDMITRSLQQALTQEPHSAPLWNQLITLLMSGQRHADALIAIERARGHFGDQPLLRAYAAACHDELGDHAAAGRLFASLQPITDPSVAINLLRHLLRTGAYEEANNFALPWTKGPHAQQFWPYLSLSWRLTADPRWEWLEGDPRLVGIYDVGEDLGSIERLAQVLRGLHVVVGQPLDQSLRGGTQTDGHLLARLEPEIRELRSAIISAVERHLAQLPPFDPTHPTLGRPRNRDIRLSGSWSVRLMGSGHHAHHIHPGGWFSSAFYVHLPDADDLGQPPAGWLVLGQAPAELGIELEPYRVIEPKPGRLALFPSTSWHGTVPFGIGDRLTVAFDVARPS